MTSLRSADAAAGSDRVGAADYYVHSWAARTGQRLAARLVDSMIALGIIALVVVVGPHGRPLAQDLIIVGLVSALEGFALVRTGSTPGMHVVGIRVAQLDRNGNPDPLTAWRRSVPVACCYAVLLPLSFLALIMPFALLLSIAFSPLRRAFHDRMSGTVVVQLGAPALISQARLSTWWQPDHGVVWSPWGRVPDLFERRRARAHRADGQWWLAGVIMVGTIVSVGIRDVPMLWLWTTLVWLAIATADEARLIAAQGATPGHARFGYEVVDMRTGRPPGRARSLLRSVVVAPLLYIPPLQILLAVWVHASALHRGPHDLIANTVVVEPGFTGHSFLAALPSPPIWAPHPQPYPYPYPYSQTLPPYPAPQVPVTPTPVAHVGPPSASPPPPGPFVPGPF